MNKTFVSFKESLLPINQISLSDDEMLLVRGGNDGGGNDAGSGAGCGCDCYSGSGCGCHCSSGAGSGLWYRQRMCGSIFMFFLLFCISR